MEKSQLNTLMIKILTLIQGAGNAGGGAFQLNYSEVRHMANRKPPSYLTGRIFDTVQGCSARGGPVQGCQRTTQYLPRSFEGCLNINKLNLLFEFSLNQNLLVSLLELVQGNTV